MFYRLLHLDKGRISLSFLPFMLAVVMRLVYSCTLTCGVPVILMSSVKVWQKCHVNHKENFFFFHQKGSLLHIVIVTSQLKVTKQQIIDLTWFLTLDHHVQIICKKQIQMVAFEIDHDTCQQISNDPECKAPNGAQCRCLMMMMMMITSELSSNWH